MNQNETMDILQKIRDGELTPEEGLKELRLEPYKDLGYAKVDSHRGIRQGVPEVIYGLSKTKEQIAGIVSAMVNHGDYNILITRVDQEKVDYLKLRLSVSEFAADEKISEGNQAEPAEAYAGQTEGDACQSIAVDYHPMAQIAIVNPKTIENPHGCIAIVSAGTSDMPVAEEAALTAEVLGNKVIRIYDSGVAGIHRLLSHMEELAEARAVVAVAGMEGALASVVGGLVDCPVIAVPTSVGYGASFNGLAALLSMLNSCASGVSVVNIDNGFGAGYQASMINQIDRKTNLD